MSIYNTQKIDKLQKKLRKQDNLLQELKEVKEYNTKTYHLIQSQCEPIRYMLIRISDKSTLIFGTLKQIKSYMNLRNINPKSVYQWEII